MTLADARAIRPDLNAVEADIAADSAMLDHIADWCGRYTPIVACDGPNGLFLDITGCAHLFGGEHGLRTDLFERLKAQGFSAQAAIAPTPGAAWALAHFGGPALIDDAGLRAALAPLPVVALRLEAETAALLNRFGLQRIGAILDAPRAPFTARAGQEAMRRLDQALGRAREAISPRRPPPPLYILRRLLAPIISLDAVLAVVDNACAALCDALDQRGMGARVLRLTLFGVDGRTREARLMLSSPALASATLVRLFKEKLCREAERWDGEFGFETVRLDALEIAPLVLRPTDLAPACGRDAKAEARLMDILRARLGAESVGRVSIRDTHSPERASAWAASARAYCSPPPPEDNVMRRPLTLLARAQLIEVMASVPDGPPLRFRWRRVLHDVARAEGPERIAPHWLKAPDARTRDYYRIEDTKGRRFWLYREGCSDAPTPPRWFLHGLFA